MFNALLAVVLALCMAACATRPDKTADGAVASSPWMEASGVVLGEAPAVLPATDASHWYHYVLPGKQATQYHFVHTDGRNAMMAEASSSASVLRRKVQVPSQALGAVHFSWKVPQLIATGDMALRDFDDTPVRIILAFDGDRSQFSAKNMMLNELTRAVTGDEMPYATLMYVWSKQRPVGTVINSPRTDRIRKLVVESGPARLNQWLDYTRDVRADFERVFHEPPGALIGIGVMTDTDNTRTQAQAWYGMLKVDARAGVQ